MVKRIAPFLLALTALMSSGCKLTEQAMGLFASPTPTLTATPAPTSTSTSSPTPTITPTPQPPARLAVGDSYIYIGDYDGAQQQFQSALDQATDDDTKAGALTGIGRVLILKGDYQSAVETLTTAITTYPSSPAKANALFHRARANDFLKNFAASAEDYKAYLELNPGAINAYVQGELGDELNAAGDYAGAIKSYEAAAEAPQLGDPLTYRIKAAIAYDSNDDVNTAVRNYMSIYQAATSEYTKAQMDWLAGQGYIKMGLPEQAYARYQDAVNNYPRSSDSYNALVELINAGITVNDLSRGMVDYYAGQYGVAIEAFTRSITADQQHNGTAHYYKALALVENNQIEQAVTELDALIHDHPGDQFYVDAVREKAYIQWAYLDHYDFAAETLLSFVRLYPTDENAAGLLFEAARIQERGGKLTDAAATWKRVMDEYPSSTDSARSLFLSGITQYRLHDYAAAQTTFQRCAVLGTSPEEQAQAYFWIGKTAQAQSKNDAAKHAWEQAAQRDPTGYYSERSRNILQGQPVLAASAAYDLGYDLSREQSAAQDWMRKTFNLPADTILSGLGDLADDPRLQRGNVFWQLGLYANARDEFDALRTSVASDPVNTFRLMNHMLKLGLYREAILASRNVLDLANLDDAASLNAPAYFNHIRFGTYFKELVLPAAKEENLNPLFLFSLIRQESMFEGFAYSSAGARGLMQIMPATGDEIVRAMGWPPDYTTSDLIRPSISIGLGARYLARQRDYLDGDLFAALAAYNGGPGNAKVWKDLSNGDPDLFLEIIRYDETRSYLTQISDFLNIYNGLYSRKP